MHTRRRYIDFAGWSIAITLLCFSMSTPSAQVRADYTGVVRLDLSGLWDFRLDATGRGESDGWFTGTSTSGWMKLAVPGSFNEQLAAKAGTPASRDAMRFYQGIAWYRTTFDSPRTLPTQKSFCYLHLSGTVLRHTVWINGQRVGSSRSPYLDESYDVSTLLQPSGKNTLVVEVANDIEERAIPDRKWHGWWDDGGLIRPVYLELRPASHGQSYVSTAMTATHAWHLSIDTQLQDKDPETANTEVSYLLTGADGRVVWNAPAQPISNDLKTEAELSKVSPWSPSHPTLYTLKTTITNGNQPPDTTSIRIGFRQIAVRDTQILLNGNPITLRGISRHQFVAGQGMSPNVMQNRRDVEAIKSLGANFVRLAHYSQSQDVYDACDELGLLVWTEIPVWQSDKETLSDPAVWNDYAQPQLKSMVMQHRNHPSVVVWSVANEIPSETPEGAAFVDKAISYVKTLDNSRLVTFASDRREKDVSFAPVDFIAVNEYFGWYYGKQQDVGPMLDDLHIRFPHKPIVVSEFGDEGVAGGKNSASTGGRDYTYAGQVEFLTTHMNQIFAQERRSFMAGGLIWVFNDFPDPQQIGKDRPAAARYVNTKGIVTADRQHKPSYKAVQEYFHRLKTQEIHPEP